MKLSKDSRRQQLLDVAMTIVREHGADELTLGTLAEKAGVSRPIAYDHFTTRAGLLLALFQRTEEQYAQALRDALRRTPRELAALADVMSDAYFNCHCDLGPEAAGISAALNGSAEMAAQRRTMLGDYVEIMRATLLPFSTAESQQLRVLCIGLLGAAEAIASELQAGHISRKAAVQAFSSLIARSVAARSVDGRKTSATQRARKSRALTRRPD